MLALVWLTPMTTRPMCIHCSDEDQSRILHIARGSVVYCRIMRELGLGAPGHRLTRESGWGLTLQHFKQLTNRCSLGQSYLDARCMWCRELQGRPERSPV